MPARPPRIFVADDQRDVTESLRLLLKGEGYTAETFDHPQALVGRAAHARARRGAHGLELHARHHVGRRGPRYDRADPRVRRAHADRRDDGLGHDRLAVEAMRRGAQDFIEKPWDNDRLLTVLRTQVALGQALNRTRVLEAANRS